MNNEEIVAFSGPLPSNVIIICIIILKYPSYCLFLYLLVLICSLFFTKTKLNEESLEYFREILSSNTYL